MSTPVHNIAIYGAGGFGKETEYLLRVINRPNNRFYFAGFLDDGITPENKAAHGTFNALAIAIASPTARRKIKGKMGSRFLYPNLISPDIHLDPSVKIGEGVIFCAGVKMTVDITVGNFVIVNLNATIGHDVTIGSFSSIMPSANISGNVVIEDNVFIGSGSTILQGLRIGKNSTVGAGAVVTKNVPANVIARGVPARFFPKKSIE